MERSEQRSVNDQSQISIFARVLYSLSQILAEPPGQTQKTQQEPPLRPNSFVSVYHDRVALRPQDASLKAVLDELGRQTEVEVVANIPPEETISDEFSGLTRG